jgi:hypothetical protein
MHDIQSLLLVLTKIQLKPIFVTNRNSEFEVSAAVHVRITFLWDIMLLQWVIMPAFRDKLVSLS